MDASFYWDLFMKTGAPEAYLQYLENKDRQGPAV